MRLRNSRQSAPPVTLRQNFHLAGGRREVAGQGAEKGGFAGTVGPDDDPMFTRPDRPGNVVKDEGRSPPYCEAGNGKNRFAIQEIR